MKKKAKIISTLGVVTLLFLWKESYDLAAPPLGEKNCDWNYPIKVDATDLQYIEKLLQNNSEDLNTLAHVTQKWWYINDASCLNKTPIYAIVRVQNTEEIQSVIQFAKKHSLKITPYGARHSMGGQSFLKWGISLNMDAISSMKLDGKILNVWAGAKWEAIQRFLDPQWLAVQAMQSINIFSVWGTISVNAHGIAHHPWPIASTIQSLTIIDPQGEIKKISKTQDPALFSRVIWGYGLYGVIVEAELEVVPNELYEWKRQYMDYKDFYQYYLENVKGKEDVGLFYGRVSLSPTSYMTEAAAHVYKKTDSVAPPNSLNLPGKNYFSRFVMNFSKTWSIGRWLRWMLEKNFEPKVHPCLTRNIAMIDHAENCQVTRNQEMYDTMNYLKNNLRDSDILQEYFIPESKMVDFIDGLKKIVKENDANLLNITVRIVEKDTVSSLPYAKEDMFAYVLYFNQKFHEEDAVILKKTTLDIIDLSARLWGTYYLPYQLYYSIEQIRTAYPEIDNFFAQKKVYDPDSLFSNTWYEKYSQLAQVK